MLTAIGKGLSATFAWMLKNPVVVLLAIFTGMFAMIVVSKNSEIATLERTSGEKDKRIETLVASLSQARTNVASLSDGIRVQNAAIDLLNERSSAASVKFDGLMAELTKGNARLQDKIAAIDAAKPGADPCQSAYALIQGSVQ